MYFTFREKKNRCVSLLLIGISFFFIISFFINLFVDGEAIINYKRAINVVLPIYLLFSLVIDQNWYRFRKLFNFIIVPYVLIIFCLYQYKIYKFGPRFNEYKIRESEVVNYTKKLIRNGSVVYTNNSPTTYMLFRKRLERVPLKNGSNEQSVVKNIENSIKSTGSVFYIELSDSDKRHINKNRLKHFFNLEIRAGEEMVQLYEMKLK